MRAARFHAAGDLRIDDIPAPDPNTPETKNKVLVRVAWCGICGTDLHEYLLGPHMIPSPKTGPHPLTHETLPVVMGHEFTGTIIQAPDGSDLAPGQAVVIDPRFFCNSCTACTQSATNCCEIAGFLGISGGGGGFSEVVAAYPEQVYVLSNWNQEAGKEAGVDLAAAALIEPLVVAWHALKLFLSITGSTAEDLRTLPILIVGAGPIAVAMAFILKAHGAQTILVSGVSKVRREFLQESGIVTDVFDAGTGDIPKRCKEVTKDGVGVVFDCAGVQDGMDAGSASLRFRGVYINLALPRGPITIPFEPFMLKEITYKCSMTYDQGDFKETVDAFLAGRFQGVERMITRRVRLEDVHEKGFKELVKPKSHIKILATPRRDLSTDL
ncbi:chaperonin 10-like protein [Aspergillus egyptiacus]|nr:chaperonin 10-like protein [Aspergillus egyptiacus]